jgi:hypothetical protein
MLAAMDILLDITILGVAVVEVVRAVMALTQAQARTLGKLVVAVKLGMAFQEAVVVVVRQT